MEVTVVTVRGAHTWAIMVVAEGREVAMRVNRGLLGWGLFFLALGGVPLAVQGGALDPALARRSWELWPLLLVGAGLGLALRNTALEAAGGIVAAVTFGLIAGGAVAAGVGPGSSFALCGGTNSAETPSAPRLAGSLASGASIDLSLDCGELSASSVTGTGWSLAWPNGHAAPEGDGPSSSSLRLRMGSQHGFGLGTTIATKWQLTLPADPDVTMAVSVNAGSARLGLGSMHVTSLTAVVNAGDAHLDLAHAIGTNSVSGSANAGSLTIALPSPGGTLVGSLSANAGSVRVCAPRDVPLRIEVRNQPLGSTNLAQRGLVQNGNTWTRGAWGSATARIDLNVSANLGSVTLDPEDGCG